MSVLTPKDILFEEIYHYLQTQLLRIVRKILQADAMGTLAEAYYTDAVRAASAFASFHRFHLEFLWRFMDPDRVLDSFRKLLFGY
ncbi:hypothetical protein BHE90_000210 [Fusarium euwallaceae]|uniref:Uncharacterized protein n=1 Tax=Fusarium euwallaceae TaxID=1147111 RepID=A0A430MB11_9HYPO|nr:hypothetical protein BHE90_000210 [Fusarium euwallaceae]